MSEREFQPTPQTDLKDKTDSTPEQSTVRANETNASPELEHKQDSTTLTEAIASPEEDRPERASGLLRRTFQRPFVRKFIGATAAGSVGIILGLGFSSEEEPTTNEPAAALSITSQPETSLKNTETTTATISVHPENERPERGFYIKDATYSSIKPNTYFDLPKETSSPQENLKRWCAGLTTAANSFDENGAKRLDLVNLLFSSNSSGRERIQGMVDVVHEMGKDPQYLDEEGMFYYFDCKTTNAERSQLYPTADVVEGQIEGFLLGRDKYVLLRSQPVTMHFVLDEVDKRYPNGEIHKGLVAQNIWTEADKIPNN